MEKLDKTLDQVLASAALNLTKLEQIHEVMSGNKQHTNTSEILKWEPKLNILDLICRLW